MANRYDLGDYKEVSERIIDFRQKYPDGSLSSEVILWPTPDLAFIAVRAKAYRSKGDEHPGVGLAWEPFPGKTPYTRDSELQNAETSAWGRAIVAALASDTKQGIASADEIRLRRQDSGASPSHGGTRAAPDQGTGPGTSPPRGQSPQPSAVGEANRAPNASPSTPASEDAAEGVAEGEAAAPTVAKCAHPEWVPAPNKAMADKGYMMCAACRHVEQRAA